MRVPPRDVVASSSIYRGGAPAASLRPREPATAPAITAA
jgi:hypothetical protein